MLDKQEQDFMTEIIELLKEYEFDDDDEEEELENFSIWLPKPTEDEKKDFFDREETDNFVIQCILKGGKDNV